MNSGQSSEARRDPWIDRHQTLFSASFSTIGPMLLVLNLYWGRLETLPASAFLVAVLVAGFLFTLLRLIVMPSRQGPPPPPSTRLWTMGITAASFVLLALAGAVGNGPVQVVHILLAVAGLLVLGTSVEVMARRQA
ncbi:MAG: hypothetical protein ACR2MY_08990 [Candidatus Dormibacteria bacterium]